MKKKMVLPMAVVAAVAGMSMVPRVFAESKDNIASYSDLNSCLTTGGEELTTCKLTSEVTMDSTITISSGNIVLDLGGQTLTAPSQDKAIVLKEGTLTIKNGTIENTYESSKGGTIYVYGSSHLTVDEGATISGVNPIVLSTEDTDNNSVVNINGTLDNNQAGAVAGAALTVQGKVSTGTAAITIGATGVLKSSVGAGIFQAGLANTMINGGKVSGPSGIVIKSGSLKLNNATVSATGTYNTASSSGNGFTSTGAAVQVDENAGYAGGVNIEFNGGNYTSENGNIVEAYGEAEGNLSKIFVGAGNSFKAGADKELFVQGSAKYEPTLAEGITLELNADGTYSSKAVSEPSSEEKSSEATKNPNTSDKIVLYVSAALLAVVGLATAVITKIKSTNN